MDYYRGCYIKQGDAPTNAQKMRHLNWFRELLPNWGHLIGWYKFNEGSGTIVKNYATDGFSGGGLLPNLNVIQNIGTFWSYLPGFGSTQQGPGIGNGLIDFAWNNSNREIGGVNKACIGIFFRPRTGIYAGDGNSLIVSSLPVQGGTEDCFIFNSQGGTGIKYAATYFSLGVDELRKGRWHFVFLNNLGYMYCVLPNGTFTISGLVDMTAVIILKWILMGFRYGNASPPTLGYYAGAGSYGDFIIYNQIALTNSHWGIWYDLLRSRYGMAARSGW